MEGFNCVVEQRVIFRDLDALGHVNNAVYATYFETGRLEYLTRAGANLNALSLILAEITMTYRSPAYLREELLIGTRVSEIRNSSFVVEAQICEKTSGRLVATSRAVIVHFDYDGGRATPVPQEWRAAMAQFEGRPL